MNETDELKDLKAETLKALQLFETITLNDAISKATVHITKIPGGFIYHFDFLPVHNTFLINTVFVPENPPVFVLNHDKNIDPNAYQYLNRDLHPGETHQHSDLAESTERKHRVEK